MKFIDKVHIAYDSDKTLYLVKINSNNIITQKRKISEHELTFLYEILKTMKGRK